MIANNVAGFLFMAVTAGSAAAIETPDYESLKKAGKFELRKYEAIPVASTPMDGMKKRNDGFRQLFNYISGENDKGEEIAMTAPVIMEDSAKDDADGKLGKMSFMLPKKVAQGVVPQPKNEALEVRQLKAGKVAVLRFSGWRSEEKRAAASDELKRWVVDQGLKPDGEPFFAFYNPPWTPEAFRRNEVWLRIAGS